MGFEGWVLGRRGAHIDVVPTGEEEIEDKEL